MFFFIHKCTQNTLMAQTSQMGIRVSKEVVGKMEAKDGKASRELKPLSMEQTPQD